MGGSAKRRHRAPATPVHKAHPKSPHAGRKHAPKPEPGFTERIIGLQNMIGNTAVNLVMEGVKAIVGPGQPAPQQTAAPVERPAPGEAVCYSSTGTVIQGPVDPWGDYVACAPLKDRVANFHKMLDDTWNREDDYEKKMEAYGNWDWYFTEQEFAQLRKDDYSLERRYEEYEKFYNPQAVKERHHFADVPMTVEYGDSQARARMRGETLENMTGSFGGALAEYVASFFTDDEEKLNAASSFGASLTDMAGATAGTYEARASQPVLNAPRAEVTMVSGGNAAELEGRAPTAAHVQPDEAGAAQTHPANSGGQAQVADPVQNAGTPAGPKVTKLPPGPPPPEQTVRVKDEPLPEGTHKITNTTRPRTKRRSDEQVLRDNMEAAGLDVPDGHAAHHMVLKRGGGHWGEIAREQLDRLDIKINDAENGVPLPGTHVPRGTVDEPIGGPYHGTIHTRAYYREVARRLVQAKTEAEGRAALRKIRQDIIDGTFPH